MAQAKRVHNGCEVDYTPSSNVTAGDVVVQGSMVGVANRDIAANELGALAVDGVFDFAKGSDTITAGAKVYWNDSSNVATTTSTSNTYIGMAVAAAATGDSTVRVKMVNA